MPEVAAKDFLCIDVGASTIKSGVITANRGHLGKTRKLATPSPCGPEDLVNRLVNIVAATPCDRVGVGFPGEFRNGRVVAPGNLSRTSGAGSPHDPVLESQWSDFPLTDALRIATGRDVMVVNDASLAALGYATGIGREFTMTLGTGCGVALTIDGQLSAIRDVGSAPFRDSTFDATLGNAAVARDESQWLQAIGDAVELLANEFGCTSIHLGGGNARRIPRTYFSETSFDVRIHDNDETLEGVIRLFDG